MNLLIDVGNSRIKWAYADSSGLTETGAALRGDTLPTEAVQSWSKKTAPQRVIVANVAGDDYANKLSDWCQQHWDVHVEFAKVQSQGFAIRIAYAEPQHLGVDRWLAMLAAFQSVDGAVCVIDCGTAVTIDAVTSDGQHLGGVIMPGFVMMQSSLLQQTAAIESAVNAALEANQFAALGHNTFAGVKIGVENAVVGGIERVIEKIEAEINEPLQCVITGGDADHIMPMLNRKPLHMPDLVLQGLQLTVGQYS